MTDPLILTLANGKACKVKLADNVEMRTVPESRDGSYIQFSLGADSLPVNSERVELKVFAPYQDRMMRVAKTLPPSGVEINEFGATAFTNTPWGVFGKITTSMRGFNEATTPIKDSPRPVNYSISEAKGAALAGEVMQKLGICLSEGKQSDSSVSLLNYKNAQAIQQHFSHTKGAAK